MWTSLFAGYLLGSLPFAFWFGALRGKPTLRGGLEDFQTLGPIPGGMVLFLDILKGILAVALGEFLAQSYQGGLLAGVGSVFGHLFSPWLFFRSGYPLAPALGALFAVDPRLLLWGLLLVLLQRWPHAALATTLSLPILTSVLGGTFAHLLFGLGLSLGVALGELRGFGRGP
ncbi:MAG: glycerol-3-phosphate acyltransferase [Thermaceae bacterium]